MAEHIREVQDVGALQLLQSAEVDQQITTARRYPRSVKASLATALELATLTVETAEECMYALPRDGKTIEGPSARLAEIIANSWGNCQAGARVVEEGPRFVTAQGVFWDLERNVRIVYEVKRRITGKGDRRYSDDMISVTANAACSIALRNAVFKGVPKALWAPIYEQARATAIGNQETLSNRRARAFAVLQKMGAPEPAVLTKLGRKGIEDVTLEDLTTLQGIRNAIKEGEISVEEAFALTPGKAEPAKQTEDLKSRLKQKASEERGDDDATQAVSPQGDTNAREAQGTAPAESGETEGAEDGVLGADPAPDETPAPAPSRDTEDAPQAEEQEHAQGGSDAPPAPVDPSAVAELIDLAETPADLDHARSYFPAIEDADALKQLRAAARAKAKELADA